MSEQAFKQTKLSDNFYHALLWNGFVDLKTDNKGTIKVTKNVEKYGRIEVEIFFNLIVVYNWGEHAIEDDMMPVILHMTPQNIIYSFNDTIVRNKYKFHVFGWAIFQIHRDTWQIYSIKTNKSYIVQYQFKHRRNNIIFTDGAPNCVLIHMMREVFGKFVLITDTAINEKSMKINQDDAQYTTIIQ